MQPSYRSYGQPPPQRSPHATSSRRGIGPMIGGAHPQQSLTQAQMQAQQEAQRNALDMAKRRSRKPTDKNMPEGLEDVIIGDGVQKYRELREVERRLDATMMRKRLDIQSVRDSNVKRYRTLRIWISNTVEDQPWQADDELDMNAFDFSTNMDASYKVKIEGRLLEDDDVDEFSDSSDDEAGEADAMDEDVKEPEKSSRQKQRHRFSQFFKSLTVEYEKTRTKDADQNVEWKKSAAPSKTASLPSAADFDQIEFKRGGDENVNVAINLVRDETPERFTLSPVLAEIMDSSEASRAEVVTGIWEYIKIMGLQEDDEKRSFRCDDLLRQVFGGRDTGYIPYIPDAILQHMTPLPPLKLPYTIRCDQSFHNDPQPTIYDIRVTLSDPLSAHLASFNQNPALPATLREIMTLNEELSLLIQRVGESKAKHTFLSQLCKEPDVFMQRWMSSQKRDLEIIMGEALRGGGEDAASEEFRRGGKDGIWGSNHVRESVNLILASRSRQGS